MRSRVAGGTADGMSSKLGEVCGGEVGIGDGGCDGACGGGGASGFGEGGVWVG